MGFRIAAATLIAMSWTSSANAKCESLVRNGARQSGAQLIKTYERLIRCDKNEAQDAYITFMQQAGSGGTEDLSALAMVAIKNQIWNPVWEMIGKISDYNARDEVAAIIGEQCAEQESVVNFLQGAYFGLRDLDFKQWDDALLTCTAPAFEEWLIRSVENPPAKQYDEKWDTLASVVVKRKKAGALEHLSTAAIKAAANNGPYDTILTHMADAVDAPFGQEPSPEDKKALQNALVSVAKKVDPERALAVAGQLSDAGAQSLAASLLGTIFPDRMSSGGVFRYAAAAVESGICKDGAKTATIHLAVVKEPGKRFDFFQEVTEPLRATKARLKKCAPDVYPWPVWVSKTPLAKGVDAEDAVTPLVQDWEGRGYKVNIRSEKTITLP
jgi:hypothetical protein